MATKEQIKKTVNEILDAYPKLKEIIDTKIPWKIDKTNSAIMLDSIGEKYESGWDCFIPAAQSLLTLR